ncbi:hypothetical protein MY11210_009332 [Beauveria gryllotalpidicola]
MWIASPAATSPFWPSAPFPDREPRRRAEATTATPPKCRVNQMPHLVRRDVAQNVHVQMLLLDMNFLWLVGMVQTSFVLVLKELKVRRNPLFELAGAAAGT